MVHPGFDVESIAQQVGAQGVDKLVTDAERICICEQRRIAFTNEPEIIRLQAEFAIQLAEERRLADRLALAPPLCDRRRLFWRAIYYWSVVAILAVAGFFSTLLSFAPFRLGWMSWLVSAGLAVLTPFLVDRLLEHPGMQRVLKILTAVAATASLGSLMLLALIRGDLMAQQIRESEAQAVVIDDAQPQSVPPNTFYDRATSLLCIALLLMAFATETGGGLVLHEAWRSSPNDTEDWIALRREMLSVRERLAEIASQIVMLRNAPDVFASRYWRDFYRALLLGATRNAMAKLLLVLFAIVALTTPCTRAEDRLNLVVAIDLSRSVASKGPDGTTDFHKNIDAVGQLLTQVPAGARVTVLGITDHSFTEPYILMSARVQDDPGYFGERLNAARIQIVRAWKQKSSQLSPDFEHTDIFGALELASQIFAIDKSAKNKELVIFSDMRESVPILDFEQMRSVASYKAMTSKCGKLPVLRNVHIHIAGADGAGKSAAYWETLHQFWSEYFQQTEATLETFSVLVELPNDR